MKASQLVRELNKIINDYGDLEIQVTSTNADTKCYVREKIECKNCDGYDNGDWCAYYAELIKDIKDCSSWHSEIIIEEDTSNCKPIDMEGLKKIFNIKNNV